MSVYRLITLYGPKEARELAKGLLENLPYVRRVDALENNTVLRLLLSKPVIETEIIGLLSDTGLNAIQFEKSAPV